MILDINAWDSLTDYHIALRNEIAQQKQTAEHLLKQTDQLQESLKTKDKTIADLEAKLQKLTKAK